MIKKCVVCGREFDGKANSRYCSEKCRETPVPIQEHVGERHGKLLIVSAYRKNSKLYAVCNCDCGNTCETRYDSIFSGLSKSCGCGTKEAQAKAIDLTGKKNKYGCTAIRSIGKDNHSHLWLCRCSCGKEFTVSMGNFEIRQSCGCAAQKTRKRNMSLAKEVFSKGIEQGTSVIMIQPNKKLLKNNTSGITGVHWAKDRQRWVAQIEFQGKHYTLGAFKDKNDAIAVRKEAEQAMFGNFLKWFRETYQDRWSVLEEARKKNKGKEAE